MSRILQIDMIKTKYLSDQYLQEQISHIKSKTEIEKLPAWNKGIKGLRHSPKTEFKPGNVPWNKGVSGCYTADQIKVLSESHKGLPSPRKGKKHTKEARRKMSESSKGQPAWNKGIPLTEECKKKKSDAIKGRVWVNNGKKNRQVYPDNIPEGYSRGRFKSPSRNNS